MRNLSSWLTAPVSIAPLVTFRVIIGAMLVFSTSRFLWLGWIEDHYTCPQFHFKYYGFYWVEPLGVWGMYIVHILLILSAIGVILGWYYRLASILLFLLFTYTELIDLTYYLNHYYFVSIVTAMLIFVPAHRSGSIDVLRRPTTLVKTIPRWMIAMFQLQLAIVYTYAGFWKINHDWLIEALPLRIWMPANDQIPGIGWLFTLTWMPWVFSWTGMLYDLTIVFWLSWSRTRVWAYLTVIVFHVLTGLMFQIGVFPLVMIGATLIFFSEKWHTQLHENIKKGFRVNLNARRTFHAKNDTFSRNNTWIFVVLGLYFSFQFLFPLRYLCYPGNVFWTEQGYRFSWRVMLMEKAGTATFFVKDQATGREGEVLNGMFLNTHQEKQMAMQPDLILQYAHFLHQYYTQKGLQNPSVRAEVYVTLNARPSRLLFDPNTNLVTLKDLWSHKHWIYEDK